MVGSIGIGAGISILQTECSEANQQVFLAPSVPTMNGENATKYEWRLEKTQNGKLRLVVFVLQ